MATKPGWQTSEFAFQALAELLAAVSTILAMMLEAEPTAKWISAAVAIVSLVAAVLGRMGYIANRTALKAGAKPKDP